MAENQNIISRGINYVKDSREELRKVHPPTAQETVRGTIGVLIMVIFFATFLGLADYVVGSLMQWIFA